MITDDYIMFGMLALAFLLLLFIGYKSAEKVYEGAGKVFLALFTLTWIIIPLGVVAPLDYFGLETIAYWTGIVNGIVSGLTVIVFILFPMAFASFIILVSAFFVSPTSQTETYRNGYTEKNYKAMTGGKPF